MSHTPLLRDDPRLRGRIELPETTERQPFTGKDFPRILAWLVEKQRGQRILIPLGEADTLTPVGNDLHCVWERQPGKVNAIGFEIQTPWTGRVDHTKSMTHRLRLDVRDTFTLRYTIHRDGTGESCCGDRR